MRACLQLAIHSTADECPRSAPAHVATLHPRANRSAHVFVVSETRPFGSHPIPRKWDRSSSAAAAAHQWHPEPHMVLVRVPLGPLTTGVQFRSLSGSKIMGGGLVVPFRTPPLVLLFDWRRSLPRHLIAFRVSHAPVTTSRAGTREQETPSSLLPGTNNSRRRPFAGVVTPAPVLRPRRLCAPAPGARTAASS
jgi:hypothetical protein